MESAHHIVFIPGLHDRSGISKVSIRLMTLFWDQREFPFHVVYPNWSEGKSFQKKLVSILRVVDELTAKHRFVSVIGQSAGGSAALNTYAVRRNELVACINVTGRLVQGNQVTPSLVTAAKSSEAFLESVLECEQYYLPTLFPSDLKKILTIRPRFDEIVPASTVAVPGATNLISQMPEHLLGGLYIMTMHSWVLKNFLRRKSSVYPRSER